MKKKTEPTADPAVDEQAAAEEQPQEAPPAQTASEGTGEPGISSGAEDYITALQAEMEDLRHRVEEAEKQSLYVQAEFQNFRRRKEDEIKEIRRFAATELISSLLPIVDSFERGLQAAGQTNNLESLVAGLSGTQKQLQAYLQKAGVTPIDALGKEFDPRYHEAIGHTESDEYPPHTIAEEVQRGYSMHDRVLRPALVKVTAG